MTDTETGLETRYYIGLRGGLQVGLRYGPAEPEVFWTHAANVPIDIDGTLCYPVSAEIHEAWTADGELGRLRRIENAARAVVEKYRGVSPVELDHLDDFGLAGVLDALAAEVERADGREKQ